MLYYSVSVNRSKPFLETSLCGAKEESPSLLLPLYFPSSSSGRWSLLSEEPLSANSAGLMVAVLCQTFPSSWYFQSLLTEKLRKLWQDDHAERLGAYERTAKSDCQQTQQLFYTELWQLCRELCLKQKDFLGVKCHSGGDEHCSPNCIPCTLGDKSYRLQLKTPFQNLASPCLEQD